MAKNKIRAVLVGAIIATGLGALPAQGASSMPTGDYTSQPIGHYTYCQTHAEECSIESRDTRPVALSRARWSQLATVNARINDSVRAVTDRALHGVEELWTLPVRGAGDCEDFALAKRELLLRAGWPASALLVTVVIQTNGEGHAVLTVRTDRGDYVLDNLDTRVLAWDETDYRYVKRQSPGHSGWWQTISDERGVLVGSVR